MLSQTSQAVTFDAFYTSSKVGVTGLTVTVDVYRGATLVVTAAAATEVGDGLYTYTLASGSVTTANNYRAVFKTSGTVDQQWIPSLWVAGENWVQNCDSDMASLATAVTGVQTTASSLATATNLATLQTTATGIKTQTDKLAFTVSGKVDANALYWNGTAITTGLPNSGKIAVTLASTDVTGNLPANVTQIAGQTASAAAGVTFPAAIGTSTFATGQNVGTATSVTGAVGSVTGNVGGSVASVTAPVTAGTVTDKTGYALSATGLDAVSIADVTSDADGRSTLPKMLRSLFNRFFNLTTQSATQQITHNDSGSATQTMTCSDNGTVASKGHSA